MIIKIEVEHAIRTGKEAKVLEIIKELSRRGLDRPADMLWKQLLLEGGASGSHLVNMDSTAEIGSFLVDPPKIRLCLSS